MYKFYVKIDESGYPTTLPATESADGLVEFVAYTTTDKEYFTRFYAKYRRDENGNWISPDNLPSLTVGALLRSQQDQGQLIADRNETIIKLQTDLATAQNDATNAKTDAATANAANATLTEKLKTTESGLLEISDFVFSQSTATTGTTTR